MRGRVIMSTMQNDRLLCDGVGRATDDMAPCGARSPGGQGRIRTVPLAGITHAQRAQMEEHNRQAMERIEGRARAAGWTTDGDGRWYCPSHST